MKKAVKGNSFNFKQMLLNQDRFGQTFTMPIEEDRQALPSRTGAICSIFLTIILIMYAGYKISILKEKKNIDIV